MPTLSLPAVQALPQPLALVQAFSQAQVQLSAHLMQPRQGAVTLSHSMNGLSLNAPRLTVQVFQIPFHRPLQRPLPQRLLSRPQPCDVPLSHHQRACGV